MIALYPEVIENIHRLSLSGPLNASRAEDIVRQFQTISWEGADSVIVDLADVPFIDGQGLAALIAGYKTFGSDQQRFQVVGPQTQARLLFRLTGYDKLFHPTAAVMAAPAHRPR